MTTPNHLLNALVSQDKDAANSAFEASIQERLADYLEVRKVELASTIFDDLREGVLTKKYDKLAKPFHVPAKDVDKMQSIQARVAVKAKKLGMSEPALWKKMRDNTWRKNVSDPKVRKGISDTYKAFKEEAIVEGGPTRKHFQQVADLLKNIPDEAKRKELAQHHAGLFKAQNPRFDHKRFFAAAGVNEDTQLDEVLSGGSKVASNQQLGRNVMANIRRATQSLGIKVNANLAAQGHKDFAKLVAKHPKAPGYALLRKLAPAKAQAVQSLTQAGVPLGSALDAHPTEFNQVIQKIKRFK